MTYYESIKKLYTDLKLYSKLKHIEDAYENKSNNDMCENIPCIMCPFYYKKELRERCEGRAGLVEALDMSLPVSGTERELYDDEISTFKAMTLWRRRCKD